MKAPPWDNGSKEPCPKTHIRAVLSRIVGEDSEVQRVSASWLQQLFVFFSESQRRRFSRSSAGKDDLVYLRMGLSSIDSRGTLAGSWTTAIVVVFTAMPWHFKLPWSARKLEQGRFEQFDDQKGAERTRSWNWKWLQNQIKLSRPFYRVSRAFGYDQNVYVALVTRGARRSTRNLPYVTITHSYVLAFFATRFLLPFRSHFCRNCSFTRRYQHDSVLELFSHFGRRTSSFWLYIHHGTWRDGRNFCGYLILRFFPNRKNSQNIVPANNSNNKVAHLPLRVNLVASLFLVGRARWFAFIRKKKKEKKRPCAQRCRSFSPFSGARTRPMQHVQLLRMLHSTAAAASV